MCGKRLPARPPRDYLTTATTTEAGSVVASDAIRQRDEGEGQGIRHAIALTSSVAIV